MDEEIVRETEVLEIVNEILKTSYLRLSYVSDKELLRVHNILAIQKILVDNPGFQFFSCKSEQIKEGHIDSLPGVRCDPLESEI